MNRAQMMISYPNLFHLMSESITAIRRAGADIVITYFARQLALSGVAAWLMATGAGGAEPEPGEASEQTYRVRWVPGAQVAGA